MVVNVSIFFFMAIKLISLGFDCFAPLSVLENSVTYIRNLGIDIAHQLMDLQIVI